MGTSTGSNGESAKGLKAQMRSSWLTLRAHLPIPWTGEACRFPTFLDGLAKYGCLGFSQQEREDAQVTKLLWKHLQGIFLTPKGQGQRCCRKRISAQAVVVIGGVLKGLS